MANIKNIVRNYDADDNLIVSANIDGIQFNNIVNEDLGLNKGSMMSRKNTVWVGTATTGTTILPAINTVDIDWNAAQVAGKTLNTTGEMLSILQTAYNYATTYNVKYNSGDGNLYDDKGTKIEVGSDYTLPTATSDVLGGVKVGDGLNISDGKLSVDSTYYVTASDLIARSYITTSEADEKYAYKYHAYDGTTYGIGTADLYGHLKISSAYTTYTSATDIALSLKGAYYMYKLFVDEIDKLNKRIETLESYHAPKPVTSVTVEPPAYTYFGRGEKQLAYSITPADAAITSVAWASSDVNEEYVQVTNNGLFTTKKPTANGSYVIITATTTSSDGSSKCGYCYVTVKEARIDRVDAGGNINSAYVPNLSYTISPKLYVQSGDGTAFDNTFNFTVKEGTNVRLNSENGKTCELTISGTGISYIDVKSNADGKTKDTVIVTINDPVNYYWYAGWKEPTETNIGEIIKDTYPASNNDATLHKAGGSTNDISTINANYLDNKLFDNRILSGGTVSNYYVVVPNGLLVYDSIGTVVCGNGKALEPYSTFKNHTVYKSSSASVYINAIIIKK